VVSGSRESAPPGALRRYALPAAILGALLLAYALRGVLVPLFFAFLVAYALDPIVDKLEAWRVPRPLGALLVMLTLVAGVVLVAIFVVPRLIDELVDASRRLPEQLLSLHARVDAWLLARWHYRLPSTWAELSSKYGTLIRDSLPEVSRISGALFGTVSAIFVVLGTLIVPIFALYLLIDFNRVVARTATLVPRRWAPDVNRLAREIHGTLGRYVRGQLIANVVLATLYATGLWLTGVRLGIAIGVMTGFLSFVPYVGLGSGTLLAVLMALLDWHGTGQLVGVVVVMSTVGLLDAMMITPRIVGGSVGLKPLEVLLTMMAAATLFGFLGVLLAVPLGAVLKIIVGHAVEAYLESDFYAEPPRRRFIRSVRPPAPAAVVPPGSDPPPSDQDLADRAAPD
jgi:predicted PurR-regulated permease PerM